MTTHSKPTPGPWLRVHSHPDDKHSASIAYIEGGGRRRPLEICAVFGCDRDAENSANADLIAAAPELLDALQVMLGHMTGGMDGDWRDCDFMALARAAIARAEGKP